MTSLTATRELRVMRVAASVTMNTIMRTQLAFLRDAGLAIVCVCDDDEWADEVRALGVDVVPLGLGRRPNPLQAVIWGARFYRLLKQERPDIAHLHNAFHGIVGRPIARLAGVPVVVQSIHNWWYLEPESSIRARVYLALERFAGRFADAVFFLNHDDLRRATAGRIVNPDRVHFIGNGIDTGSLERRLAMVSRVEERRRLNLAPDDLAITMIARLEHPKDHDTLLRGFARLAEDAPNAKLLLAGQGLEEASIRRLASSLRIGESTRFLGHVSDVSGLLKASDCLVLTSYYEGISRCVIEGLVARLPVVGSDTVGIRDVISHERTGLLVRPRDVDELYAALSRLSSDPLARRRLGEAGHAAAMRDFDEALPAQRVLDLYQSLLAAKMGRAEEAGMLRFRQRLRLGKVRG
jgi:glycosyltransferase involved in cell wall biosynthesis